MLARTVERDAVGRCARVHGAQRLAVAVQHQQLVAELERGDIGFPVRRHLDAARPHAMAFGVDGLQALAGAHIVHGQGVVRLVRDHDAASIRRDFDALGLGPAHDVTQNLALLQVDDGHACGLVVTVVIVLAVMGAGLGRLACRRGLVRHESQVAAHAHELRVLADVDALHHHLAGNVDDLHVAGLAHGHHELPPICGDADAARTLPLDGDLGAGLEGVQIEHGDAAILMADIGQPPADFCGSGGHSGAIGGHRHAGLPAGRHRQAGHGRQAQAQHGSGHSTHGLSPRWSLDTGSRCTTSGVILRRTPPPAWRLRRPSARPPDRVPRPPARAAR